MDFSFKKNIKLNWHLYLLILVFGSLSYFAKNFPYFSFDLVITNIIQSINNPLLLIVMRLLSDVGEAEMILPFAGLLMIFLYSKKRRLEAIFLLFSIVLTSVLTVLFKAYVSRARPDPEMIIYQYHEFLKADSYPSGHVLIFMGVFGFLIYLSYTHFPKSLVRNLVLGFLVLALFLVGLSRIYLGAHWFSDVMGGYLLGLICLKITIFLYRSFKKNETT